MPREAHTPTDEKCPRAYSGQKHCPTTYPAGSRAAKDTGCVTPGTRGGPLDRSKR